MFVFLYPKHSFPIGNHLFTKKSNWMTIVEYKLFALLSQALLAFFFFFFFIYHKALRRRLLLVNQVLLLLADRYEA